MFERLRFIQTNHPPVTSDYWKAPAQELYNQFKYYEEASLDLRTNIWPACARAYFCRRTLPDNEGMDWANGSDLGETDIWDSVNYAGDALSLALFPRDQSYLELLSQYEEDQGLLNDIRDLLMMYHRQADTRGQYARHIKQMLIYGTSAIRWTWRTIEDHKQFPPAETLRRLLEEGVELDPYEDITKTYKKYKFPVKTFNGPVIQPVDMYDLFLDPAADLSNEHKASIIQRLYLTPEELEAAEDENGEKRYDNIKGIEPMSLEQIYGQEAERLELVNELGLNPVASGNSGKKLIPVYVFHQPVRKFDSDSAKFVDTYFYLALSNSTDQFRIIRVEDNPNAQLGGQRTGSRGLYIDSYVDWLSGAYGIGAVEKSLSAYEQKNVVAALSLNAQLASVFPAYTVIGGVLQDDNKLKMAPGSINVINYKPAIGTNFIAPVPAPIGTVQLGMQSEQWYGQKIVGQFQAYGAMAQDPTKSIKTAKTATEINTQSSTGSVMRDNLLEKITTRSVEPLFQDVYEAARLWVDEINTFEKSADGDGRLGTVNKMDLDKDRRVICTGFHGQMNKAKEIEELQNALQIMTTGNALEQLPTLRPVLQDLVFKLLGRLGVKNLEQYKQDPMTLIMNDPNIQAMIEQEIQNRIAQLTGQPAVPSPQGPPPDAVPDPMMGDPQAA